MTDWGFGLALLTVGMGGTLFALWLLSALVVLLKRLFPHTEAKGTDRGGGG
jgi:hypothetical protein